MRIGINGRFLVAKRTGVQRAAYNMLTSMISVDRNNQYYIFTSDEQLGRPEWDYDNVTIVPSKIRGGENFKNHIWEQLTLPKLAKKFKVDILHSPANIAPLLYKGKSIINIHDLCFVVNPQWYSFTFRTLYNFIIPRLARSATKVITNSNNSKNDLLQFCQLDSNKVSMVYWAVDETFQKHLPKDRSKLYEKEDYILYVGSLEPRKNITTLVEAYEQLRKANPDIKTKLVMIGGENPLFADVRLKIKSFKEDVIFKGFIDDATLINYYQNATVVAYPSLYEGFGLPPLEAMASGTPVVTSLVSSIPEVVGDAALLVSPYGAEQLTNSLAMIIRNKNLQRKMIDRGLKQIQNFNWSRVARNVLSIYYEVYHNKNEKGKEPEFIPFDEWKRLKDLESSPSS